MHYTFYPKGVCSTQIDLDVDDNGRVHNIAYTGGCNGNLKAAFRFGGRADRCGSGE